jgi:hypothetical protein
VRTSLIAFCTAAGVVALAAVLLGPAPPLPPPLEERVELPEPPKLLVVAGEASRREAPSVPAHPHGTLRIGVPRMPSMHEAEVARDDVAGQLLHELTTECLTSWNPRSGEAEPGIAERWEHNADHTQWTFHLRADARWSDGDPIVAQNFVQAWLRRIRNGNAPDDMKQFLDVRRGDIAGIWPSFRVPRFGPYERLAANDAARTIAMHLRDPCADWPLRLSRPGFGPLHFSVLDDAEHEARRTTRPCSGWFVPAAASKDVPGVLRLRRNPYHRNAESAGPEWVELHALASRRALAAAFEDGRLDWVPVMRVDTVPSAPLSYEAIRKSLPTRTHGVLIGFGKTRAGPRAQDALRAAIRVALRPDGVPGELSAEGEAALLRLVRDSPGLHEPGPLTLLVYQPTADRSPRLAALVNHVTARMGDKLGFETVVKVEREWPRLVARLQANDFDLAITGRDLPPAGALRTAAEREAAAGPTLLAHYDMGLADLIRPGLVGVAARESTNRVTVRGTGFLSRD